jgi:transposase
MRHGRRPSRICPGTNPALRRVDDRRVISGILHVLKAGCRWCDCPADYGPSTTVYDRFNRRSRRGFWLKLLDALVDAGGVTKSTAIDGKYVKAQRAAFGEKGALGTGDRPLAWWLDDQGPRAHRRHRPSLCADADVAQRQRHEGRTRATRTCRGHAATCSATRAMTLTGYAAWLAMPVSRPSYPAVATASAPSATTGGASATGTSSRTPSAASRSSAASTSATTSWPPTSSQPWHSPPLSPSGSE